VQEHRNNVQQNSNRKVKEKIKITSRIFSKEELSIIIDGHPQIDEIILKIKVKII
jgi:hypothetical protein